MYIKTGKDMEQYIHTSWPTYKDIAEDAYNQMIELDKNGRIKRADGKGWVYKYDPEHKSFKQALISIVFTAMWLEAILHILIFKYYGKKTFEDYDHKSYEKKLMFLGCDNQELLNRVTRFRKTRKSLLHEKAYDDDLYEIRIAQDEAENAHEIRNSIHYYFFGNQKQKVNSLDY
jgi:hypothetical protein